MNKRILERIDFKKNWIYETIVTTIDGKRNNAAPIGICTKNFYEIEFEMYKNSQTCKNVLATNELVVNFVDEPEIFYDALCAKGKVEYKKAKKVFAPVLREADSWLELKVKRSKKDDKTIKICAEIISYTIKKKPVKLLNRAKFLTIESLIKATKVPFKRNEIEEDLRVIKKVALDSEYEKIVNKILRRWKRSG